MAKDLKDSAHEDAKRPEIADKSEIEALGRSVVDAIYKVHTGLGPGLLESVYESVLQHELIKRGLSIERQKPISFSYDGLTFADGFRVDLLVDARVIVEVKSVERLLPVHSKQVLTYLRLMKLPLGFLINFGAPTMKLGLHRIINGEVPSAASRLRVHKSEPATGGGE